ncbi:MAG: hypothetical protein HYZ54_09340 [Ignavibacteriae bacterium]|nr:hypothetical protein [Ignavibacteriota bacterium]
MAFNKLTIENNSLVCRWLFKIALFTEWLYTQRILMKISKDNFFALGSDLKIPSEQVKAFWTALAKCDNPSRATPFAKYLFYFGAMVIIFPIALFIELNWQLFEGGGIFLIATTCACIFTLVGYLLWNKKGLKTPSGLFIASAVCMVPLAISGLETYFGMRLGDMLGHYSSFNRILIELGTILAGTIALFFFPFPFLIAPIFFFAWFLTIDTARLVFGKGVGWEERCWISICFGLILIATNFVIERKRKEGYGLWSYLFGTLSLWGGLYYLVWNKGEFALFIFLIVNLVMMYFSILVRRKVLMAFGTVGVFVYFSHLIYNIFENSVLLPFVLSLVGLAIVCLGILYQKNFGWIERNIFKKFLSGIRTFLDNHKGD